MTAAKKAWQEALNKASEQIAQSKSEIDRLQREKNDELNSLRYFSAQKNNVFELKNYRSKMTDAQGSKEQALTLLKLEFQKEKALLRAELTEEKRALEERLIQG